MQSLIFLELGKSSRKMLEKDFCTPRSGTKASWPILVTSRKEGQAIKKAVGMQREGTRDLLDIISRDTIENWK